MKKYSAQEIKRLVHLFHSEMTEKHRYASFDFCHSYFQNNREHIADKIEVSCMYLWGYLASWGMLRGSSELLQNSPASLKGLVTLFATNSNSRIWDLDMENYSEGNAINGITGDKNFYTR